MIYRKDIDGLRALAVMAVVLYHLGFQSLSGGFIGVDIFFVISGYLITLSIIDDIKHQTFTISSFYIKRIRRIIPALFTITLTTIIASLIILPHYELEEFALSVIGVASFLSNIFFWLHLDYFSVSSELKPLLHTWSLGIEEQFYILFPLFMMITYKWPSRKTLYYLGTFFIFSFLLSISSLAIENPTANFFLPITRFWELLAGSILAISIKKLNYQHLIWHQILSFIGLGLIIFPIFLLDKYSIFPGFNALYPVVGTVLIIYANKNHHTYILQLLSFSAIRYIGLISYSMYLWHWPIIALSKQLVIGDFSLFLKISIFLLVFLLSVLSYIFIEQPFRKNTKLKQFLQLKIGFLALSILFFIASAIFISTQQSATKIPPQNNNEAGCFTQLETLESTKRCSIGEKESTKIFVLYGDSHAGAMVSIFEKLAKEHHYRGIILPLTGCPPLFNIYRLDNDRIAKRCKGQYSDNMEKFLESNKEDIERIFLVARWGLYETGWIVNGRLHPMAHFLSDKQTKSKNPTDSVKVLKRGLIRTVDKLSKKLNIKTTIIAPVPVLSGNIYHPNTTAPTQKEYTVQRAFIDKIFNTFKHNNLVNIIDPINLFCTDSMCNMYDTNNIKLYKDDNHVSSDGALKFEPLLRPLFQ